MNPNRYADLDQAISAEVRAEFARQRDSKTVAELARIMGARRATISVRVNGHQAFTGGQLVQVAHYLGTSAENLTREAEKRFHGAAAEKVAA